MIKRQEYMNELLKTYAISYRQCSVQYAIWWYRVFCIRWLGRFARVSFQVSNRIVFRTTSLNEFGFIFFIFQKCRTLIEQSTSSIMTSLAKLYNTKFQIALGDNFYFDGVKDVCIYFFIVFFVFVLFLINFFCI